MKELFYTFFIDILLLVFPRIFRELLKFVFVIAAFACLLNFCLTLNITCINLIIMTYATSDHWPLKDGLRIGHLNINHLINKMSDASHIVHNSKPYGRGFHIFCFSESRLNNHMDDKDIAIEGFHVIRKDPQIQRETGLMCVSMKLCLFHALLSLKGMG